MSRVLTKQIAGERHKAGPPLGVLYGSPSKHGPKADEASNSDKEIAIKAPTEGHSNNEKSPTLRQYGQVTCMYSTLIYDLPLRKGTAKKKSNLHLYL